MAVGTVEVELMKAPIKTWRERESGMVLTEDVKGSENIEDGDGPEPEEVGVRAVV